MTKHKHKVQELIKDARTFRRLYTPTLNPQDWYLGGYTGGRYREYEYGDVGGERKIIAQNMSVMNIKRQEKMHDINLLNRE